MFGFLKKKKKITTQDYTFLKAVSKNLAKNYPYLINQITEEFILDKKTDHKDVNGKFNIVFDPELESKFSNSISPQYFVIKNILIWDKKKQCFADVELHLVHGVLSAYRIKSNTSDLDLNKIDTSKVEEKHFADNNVKDLKKIIGNIPTQDIKMLDIESTTKIEVAEGVFYTIKFLGDGNYLSVNSNGAVFCMIHDPYEIEKIFDSVNDFFNSLKADSLSIDKYYENKML